MYDTAPKTVLILLVLYSTKYQSVFLWCLIYNFDKHVWYCTQRKVLQNKSKSILILFLWKEHIDFEPNLGLELGSDEDRVNFYNDYARGNGFSTQYF